MSGLYNFVFGENSDADVILACLGLQRDDFGRYRDCFVSQGKVAVYTRCGGGNRDDYGGTIDKLREHANFHHDEDDSFDSTYCTFWFRFPEDFREDLEKMDKGEKFEPSKKWTDAIDALAARVRKDETK